MHPAVAGLVERSIAAPGFSARVLLTTIFGDALLPRDQEVAVQALASLVEPLDINDRLVRTSLNRLTREGVVVSERRGRQSHYRVAPGAIDTFERANERIYGPPISNDGWDGAWTIAVVDPAVGERAVRTQLITELGWIGLRPVAPGTLASPTVPLQVVEAVAAKSEAELGLLARTPIAGGTVTTATGLASQLDPDGRLRAMHIEHRERFAGLDAVVGELRGHESFLVRTLLIDSWRRIALRSPLLPMSLLPEGWPSLDNHRLTSELHAACLESSEGWLADVVGPGDRRAGSGFSAHATR